MPEAGVIGVLINPVRHQTNRSNQKITKLKLTLIPNKKLLKLIADSVEVPVLIPPYRLICVFRKAL